jgi:hypothetical protein
MMKCLSIFRYGVSDYFVDQPSLTALSENLQKITIVFLRHGGIINPFFLSEQRLEEWVSPLFVF